MSEAFEKLIGIKRKYRENEYEVPAIRVDSDTYYQLISEAEFVAKDDPDFVFELEHEEAVGMAGGMEIIPDDSISGPVPDDVRGMWRDE